MIIAEFGQALTVCRHCSTCLTGMKSSQEPSEVGVIFVPIYSEEAMGSSVIC